MDGHDLVIPYDLASSAKYEAVRGSQIDNYVNGSSGAVTGRRRDTLVALSGLNSDGSTADGRSFALPAEMQALADLYHNNNMAIIGNVGPLVEPVSRATYFNGSASLPPRLFSHNDQRSVWMASHPEGAASGWGGKFADIMVAANANLEASFTAVSFAGNTVFITGDTTQGFTASNSGSGLTVSSIANNGFLGSSGFANAYRANLFGRDAQFSNYLRQDVAQLTGNAIDNNILLTSVLSDAPESAVTFPETGLAQQLKAVAKMISARSGLGMKRQIFFVQQPNTYDTHSDQTVNLPLNQQELADAISAFYQETEAMGVAEQVCTFTASDFGRSLQFNNTGTDHGWGSHHLVVSGGLANGGLIYGNIPEAEFNHDQDAGRGRLIPETSVDQYAYGLARWFGLSESEAVDVLPNISHFARAKLDGLWH